MKWISVKDRMPEDDEWCVGWDIMSGEWISIKRHGDQLVDSACPDTILTNYISHWFIPEPPQTRTK